MRHWSQPRGQLNQNQTRRNAGFSLIELMVAVTILSLLFLIAVPTYQRIQRKARSAALVNDLRVFAAAFQAHAHETGSWPPEVGPGIIPAGMTSEEFKTDDWSHPTPIGGKFDWEYNSNNVGGVYTAAIRITSTSDAPLVPDDELLVEIDRTIDDGDLGTGNFIRGFGGDPLFIIEK